MQRKLGRRYGANPRRFAKGELCRIGRRKAIGNCPGQESRQAQSLVGLATPASSCAHSLLRKPRCVTALPSSLLPSAEILRWANRLCFARRKCNGNAGVGDPVKNCHRLSRSRCREHDSKCMRQFQKPGFRVTWSEPAPMEISFLLPTLTCSFLRGRKRQTQLFRNSPDAHAVVRCLHQQ